MKSISRSILFVLLFWIPHIAVSGDLSLSQTLPDNSIYHIESQWRDQQGVSFNITELKGTVRLVAFVYTYCEHTCPVIITRIKSLIKSLSKTSQREIMVTLVTLDPDRDTVERVEEYMREKELDDETWQVLVGSSDDVLTLSALFDVRYKPMGESDIAHSNVITLLDRNGVIRKQLKGLSQKPDELIQMAENLILNTK